MYPTRGSKLADQNRPPIYRLLSKSMDLEKDKKDGQIGGLLPSIKMASVKLEWPSLNRGGGRWRYLSPSYNAVLSSLPRQINNPDSPSPHLGWVKKYHDLDEWDISSPDTNTDNGVHAHSY